MFSDLFLWASHGTKHFSTLPYLIFKAVIYAHEETSMKSSYSVYCKEEFQLRFLPTQTGLSTYEFQVRDFFQRKSSYTFYIQLVNINIL